MEPNRKQLADLARLVSETTPSELDCGAVLDLLAPLLERTRSGEADSSELEAARQHLRVCPECREEYEALERLYEEGALGGLSPELFSSIAGVRPAGAGASKGVNRDEHHGPTFEPSSPHERPMNAMSKLLLAARLIAALPLLSIGLQHMLGLAPMRPILEGAGLPFPAVGAIVAPIVEVAAGALLLVGRFPRVASLLAMGSMMGALVAHVRFDHVRFDWADEPPIALPLVVLTAAATVVVSSWAERSSERLGESYRESLADA